MPLTAAQRSAATQKAWIQRKINAALRASGQMPAPTPKRHAAPRLCACGCGITVAVGGVRRGGKWYVPHHAPTPRRRNRLCACGCGRLMTGRQRYFAGHRPKRVRPPRPPRPVNQNPFAAVPQDATSLLLVALMDSEKACAAKCAESHLTDDQRMAINRALKQYNKVKTKALAGLKSTDEGIKNEAKVALSTAVCQMIRLSI